MATTLAQRQYHREATRRWRERNPEYGKEYDRRCRERARATRQVSDQLCQCGCGQRTYIATKSGRGMRAGEPLRFLHGHSSTGSGAWVKIRFIEEDRGYATHCWIWQLKKDRNGYGKLKVKDKDWSAHRWYYVQHVGVIPEGYVVDHLCSQAPCVNPDHLEAVTTQTNQWRALATRLGLTHEQRESLKVWMDQTLTPQQLVQFGESFTWHPKR